MNKQMMMMMMMMMVMVGVRVCVSICVNVRISNQASAFYPWSCAALCVMSDTEAPLMFLSFNY